MPGRWRYGLYGPAGARYAIGGGQCAELCRGGAQILGDRAPHRLSGRLSDWAPAERTREKILVRPARGNGRHRQQSAGPWTACAGRCSCGGCWIAGRARQPARKRCLGSRPACRTWIGCWTGSTMAGCMWSPGGHQAANRYWACNWPVRRCCAIGGWRFLAGSAEAAEVVHRLMASDAARSGRSSPRALSRTNGIQ